MKRTRTKKKLHRPNRSSLLHIEQRKIVLKDCKPDLSVLSSRDDEAPQRSNYCCRRTNNESDFCSNEIISSKYTALNFIPKNLSLQLAPWLKPANFYFLCIAFFQSIKDISTTDGSPMILLPLLTVLGVTALKDAYEDYVRHKIDKEKNYAKFKSYQDGKWIDTHSKDLKVGDLVFMSEGMAAPADLLLLCSGEFGGAHCYIDTKALDGETNLKPKYVPGTVLESFNSVTDALPENKEEFIDRIPKNIELTCHQPDDNMHEWFADCKTEEQNVDHLSINHLMITYSKLKGTAWIVGMIIYTGNQTKIRQNIGSRLSVVWKQTRVFTFTKHVLASIAGIELTMCILFGILSALMRRDDWYYFVDTSKASDSRFYTGFLRIFTWCIILKDIVPIAMYVTLEMVQFAQACFIYWDLEMSVVRDGKREFAICQTSNLSEELGEIQYIFTDKTGTLTENSMSFKKCIIGGRQYGTGTTVAGVIKRAREHKLTVESELERFKKENERTKKLHSHVDFNEEEKMLDILTTAMKSVDTDDKHHKEVREFFFCLALNNVIFPKIEGQGKIDVADPNCDIKLLMESNSPDETALACFAQWLGIELFFRKGNKVWLRVGHQASFDDKCGNKEEKNDDDNKDNKNSHSGDAYFKRFEEICVIKFSSKRKRMTSIIRELDPNTGEPTGKIKIYCKGADSIVKKLCEKKNEAKENEAKEITEKNDEWSPTQKKLDEFGDESLRCLVVAYSEQDLTWWYGNGETDTLQAKYEKAKQSENLTSQEKGHDVGFCTSRCSLCRVEDEIEYAADLNVLGITAIEDKLQDEVPATLKKLLQADIKIWMLTGDNIKAGINIGISCNLIDAQMDRDGRLFMLDSDIRSIEAMDKEIDRYEDQMIKWKETNPSSTFGIAIHSEVWKLVSSDDAEGETRRFFDFASKCSSVIACRLEPKEKADMVVMVREREKKAGNVNVRVLAIGDGNNDTPMIKKADVGVGLRGSEGTQAVAHADYVISQFKFMQKLILVYGRLNARRIAGTINYIFYKACILVMAMVYFGAYSSYSGTFLFLDWAYQCHNTVFTSFPIVIYGVFDRDLDDKIMLEFPKIYALSRGSFHSLRIFLRWQWLAFAQITIIYFIPWYSTTSEIYEESGQIFGVWAKGAVVYTSLVIISITKLMYEYRSWMWPHWTFMIGSLFMFVVAMAFFSASTGWSIGGADYFFVWFRLWYSPLYWLITLLTVTTASLIDLLFTQCKQVFLPEMMDTVLVKANETLANPIVREENIAKALNLSTDKFSIKTEPGPGTPLVELSPIGRKSNEMNSKQTLSDP